MFFSVPDIISRLKKKPNEKKIFHLDKRARNVWRLLHCIFFPKKTCIYIVIFQVFSGETQVEEFLKNLEKLQCKCSFFLKKSRKCISGLSYFFRQNIIFIYDHYKVFHKKKYHSSVFLSRHVVPPMAPALVETTYRGGQERAEGAAK